MYKISEIEDILNLPDAIKKCAISQDEVLKYLYHYNRSGNSNGLNVEAIKNIYIKYLRNVVQGFEPKFADIVLKTNDINRIRNCKSFQ